MNAPAVQSGFDGADIILLLQCRCSFVSIPISLGMVADFVSSEEACSPTWLSPCGDV